MDRCFNVLAFDYGTKKIGVAVGETSAFSTKALDIIKIKQDIINWDLINKLINQWNPKYLLVGLPLNMDGTEQKMTELAREFANNLEEKFKLKVCLVDERLSTRAANWHMQELAELKLLKKTKSRYIDNIAAEFIIKTWFEEFYEE